MKRIVAIVLGVLVLLAAAMMLSVWRASQEPVAHTPGPLEIGRTELRAQLDDAKKIEAQTEQQDWNSTANLRALVQGHEQRIAKLKDNSQAAEIVAYDRDAVTRLEKRITELAEQQAAKAAEQEAQP
jgi:ABC-type lipoprotein release transport system permease subunit